MRKINTTLIVLVAFVVCACANARKDALRAGLVSLNVARDTTVALEHKRAEQIIAAATTKEEARTKVDALRAVFDPVLAAIEAGYLASHTAWIINDVKSASDALAAVAKALALVKELGK